MEPITEIEVANLFADKLPSMEQISQLTAFVNSSQISQIEFAEKVEENMSKTSPRKCLATGIGLFILGKNEEAIVKLNKSKDSKEKYMYLAFAFRRLGQFDSAIENLQKSLKFEADNLSVALEKVSTYRQAFNFEAAEKELKACSNFEKVSAEYHYQLARLRDSQGEYEQAVENYKTALDLSPNHQKSLFYLAYRCDLRGNEDEAIDYYKQIASANPVYVSALMNLTVLYEDAGKFDKAAVCIEKVLKHHPNHARARLFKKDIESSRTMFYDEEKEKKISRTAQILETPISDFELSVRSRNCLRKMKIRTLGDLLKISEAELLSYKNFGETSLREIKVILESKSLQLTMPIEEHQHPLETGDYSFAEGQPENEELLRNSIDALQLSVRARKCVEKLNIKTMGDLVRRTEAELLGCKNFGVTSLNEIKKAINAIGLSLRQLD